MTQSAVATPDAEVPEAAGQHRGLTLGLTIAGKYGTIIGLAVIVIVVHETSSPGAAARQDWKSLE